MRQATLAGAALAVLTHFSAHAAQIPLRADLDAADSWDLNAAPNINATGHLVFDTVSSFLQHWPNTRYRNGISPLALLIY